MQLAKLDPVLQCGRPDAGDPGNLGGEVPFQRICEPDPNFIFAKRQLIACALCASALLLQGVGAEAAQPRVAVTAIGYEVSEPVISIAWVDNNQVLFVGQKSSPDPKKRSFAPGKMYIWNESTKVIREYADATSFCYAEGWIRYGSGKKDEAGNRIVYAGPLGKEEAIKVSPSRPSGWRGSNKFSCRSYSPADFVPPLPESHAHLVLREGDGYLTLRPLDPRERQAFPRNLTLYQAKTGKAIQLLMTWDEDIGSFGTGYSQFRGAYVLPPRLSPGSGVTGEWPSGQPRIVYLLWADGRVERISIPPSAGFVVPRPVRAGWIYGGGRSKSAGLYLFDGERVANLESGGISKIDISPDGCKAAVAINNRPLEMGMPVNLKIFDFCSGGK